jgi:hypothetical protein
MLGVIPKIDHNVPSEDSLDGTTNRGNQYLEISKIDKEIDKVSDIIESVIDMDHILKKIIR